MVSSETVFILIFTASYRDNAYQILVFFEITTTEASKIGETHEILFYSAQ